MSMAEIKKICKEKGVLLYQLAVSLELTEGQFNYRLRNYDLTEEEAEYVLARIDEIAERNKKLWKIGVPS